MRTDRMFHSDAQTFLVHLFGRGLDDQRYVVETCRCQADGQIRPDPAEPSQTKDRRRQCRKIVSRKTVREMQPERDQIIVCTGVKLAGSGIQLYGAYATGLFAARFAR